jgi:hypothetical protein
MIRHSALAGLAGTLVAAVAVAASPSGTLPEARYTTIERTPAVPFAIIAAAGVAGAGLWWAANRDRSRQANRSAARR